MQVGDDGRHLFRTLTDDWRAIANKASIQKMNVERRRYALALDLVSAVFAHKDRQPSVYKPSAGRTRRIIRTT